MDKQLDRLVDLLVENAMVVVSGTKAADEIGVPHSTLAHWIDRLREQGVVIEGMPGRGFLLKTIPDLLTEEVIRHAAHGTQFGAEIRHYYRVGSTMNEAARLAAEGVSHGAIVVAEEQSEGRGRLGRSWHSERSTGIYCSLLLRPKVPAARAPVLTLAAARAVADTATEVSGVESDLRWPNDVLLNGKKCCGILPEMTAELERVRHMILGIGLNVNQQRFPDDIAGEATSLAKAAGRKQARAEVLALLLRALDRRYDQFAQGGAGMLIEEFEARSSFARGRHVSVTNEPETFTGVTQGLDKLGFLLVRRDDSGATEPVFAGMVRPV